MSRTFLDSLSKQIQVICRAVETSRSQGRLSKPAAHIRFGIRLQPNLLEDGYDIRTVQELLGHNEVSATMIYVSNQSGKGLHSPAHGL